LGSQGCGEKEHEEREEEKEGLYGTRPLQFDDKLRAASYVQPDRKFCPKLARFDCRSYDSVMLLQPTRTEEIEC
jgi:hypothetical protein